MERTDLRDRSRSARRFASGAALALTALAGVAAAQGGGPALEESQRLVPVGPPEGAEHGASVALDGPWAMVGAPGPEPAAGAVYFYQRVTGGLELHTKFTQLDGQNGDHCGSSVAMLDGRWAFAGVPHRDTVGDNSGQVRVFELQDDGTWRNTRTLDASQPQAQAMFGSAVATEGEWLCVGAPLEDSTAPDAGAAYIYRLVDGEWTFHQRLVPPTFPTGALHGTCADFDGGFLMVGAPGGTGHVRLYRLEDVDGTPTWKQIGLFSDDGAEGYGRSLAFEDRMLFVGAPLTDGDGVDRGQVLVYELNFPALEFRFRVLGEHDGDMLGHSVALQIDRDGLSKALVGVPFDDGMATDAGAVRVYSSENDGPWGSAGSLRPAFGADGARFGLSLAVLDEFALAGAPRRVVEGVRCGDTSDLVWTEEGFAPNGRLAPVDEGSEDRYGQDLDVEGDLAVVCAPGESDLVARGGAAYVLERIGGEWVQTARLSAGANADRGAQFGAKVDIDPAGDRFVIGAQIEDASDESSGAAYVFGRDPQGQWVQVAHLVPEPGAFNARFGGSVAIDGDVVAIGSFLADGNAERSGALYVFRRNLIGEYVFEQRLIDPEGQEGDLLGVSILIDGDELLAGTIAAVDGVAFVGTVERFRRADGVWSHVGQLEGTEPEGGFGGALALDGDRLAVGASSVAENTGQVHLFRRDGEDWLPDGVLVSPEPQTFSHFGFSVDVEGGRFLVGAPFHDGFAFDSGAVWRFELAGGEWQAETLLPSDPDVRADFGTAVRLSGTTALIGSPGRANREPESGAAYSFELDPPAGFLAYGFGDGSSGQPCGCHGESAPGAGEGCRNSTGVGAILEAKGSASLAAGDLFFEGHQLPVYQPALLFMSAQASSGVPFGDGLLFLGPASTHLVTGYSDGTGIAVLGLDAATTGSLQPGDVRFFQAWYRDAGGGVCPSALNLTSAVQVGFGE
jgi:hypothetical protein